MGAFLRTARFMGLVARYKSFVELSINNVTVTPTINPKIVQIIYSIILLPLIVEY